MTSHTVIEKRSAEYARVDVLTPLKPEDDWFDDCCKRVREDGTLGLIIAVIK